jgi:hypothetical protein
MLKSTTQIAPVSPTLPASSGLLQRKCACGKNASGGEQCEGCKKKALQRHAISNSGPAIAPPIVHEVLRSPGQPLDKATRDFMEPRLGRDFSHVRVHTDEKAAESARAVNAEAYTVFRDLVFDTGGYRPQTEAGRQLLMHELTHVAQQHSIQARNTDDLLIDPNPHLEAEANAASPALPGFLPSAMGFQPSLQRAPRAGGRAPAPPHIRQIVVNQNSSQQVTATFSDGHTESDTCSTGKGHCCFDATSGTAEGGACTPARSLQVGNNCTPIGSFLVTDKVRTTAGGINFWTQFHDAKSVALHEYTPVTGEPLSHGCVRLHTAMAQTIFNGSVQGVTRVRVDGLARPNCDDAVLQREWQNDFATAGSTPPDGQVVDPFLGRRPTRAEIARAAHNIQETRSELQSAFGVNDAGLTTTLAGSPSIPRCVPTRTTEEQTRSNAVTSGVIAASASTQATALQRALARARNNAAAEQAVRQAGEQLWQDATQRARVGGSGTDDRQLYWTRLEMTLIIRDWDPSWTPNADTLRRLHENLLQIFERTSRGMTTASFGGASTSGGAAPANANPKRILVSGFDPFGFQSGGDIRQSNLSGAAALALDGATLTDGTVTARVESIVYPVRYADFNAGMVENFIRPQLTGPTPPHFVVSISQGGSQFELEEWAGRRRSTTGYQDNLGTEGGGTPMRPVVSPGVGAGREFERTTVSQPGLTSMRGAMGRSNPAAIPQETTVRDLPPGATAPRDLPGGPMSTPASRPGGSPGPGIAVEGSGGGFLSNEIFYRNLVTGSGTSIPMVHLHTPTLTAGASDATRNALINDIRRILTAALPHI